MPIDTGKVGDNASRKGAIPFEEDAMKNGLNDKLVEAIEKLSEDNKKQVVEFIYNLDPRLKASLTGTSVNLSSAEIAKINAFTERMCDKAKSSEEFDVLEVMEAMRR